MHTYKTLFAMMHENFFPFVKSKNKLIIDHDDLCSDPLTKSDILSKIFQSVFINEDISTMPRLSSSAYPTMSHSNIHTSGVENLLRNLNPYKAAGPDAIPAHLLRELSAEVAPASTFAPQMSLDTGKIPDDLRMAIVPVYERGNKCSEEKYRPVSMTFTCSKVMEHIMFSNIMQHLDKNSILMEAQHGFRKNNSCEIRIITIIEDMACNLSNSTQIDAPYLNFAKAFDNVPRQRLLLKLEYHSIRSNTSQWIGSFSYNMKQCVIVECVSSNVVPVTLVFHKVLCFLCFSYLY